MSQFLKVDVNYANHPKVLAAGEKLAMRNLAAMGWSFQMGTDGHIPVSALPTLRMTRRDAERLVRHRLWDVNGDGGWRIHDYEDWQVTTEGRDEARRLARERQAKRRKQLREAAGGDAA